MLNDQGFCVIESATESATKKSKKARSDEDFVVAMPIGGAPTISVVPPSFIRRFDILGVELQLAPCVFAAFDDESVSRLEDILRAAPRVVAKHVCDFIASVYEEGGDIGGVLKIADKVFKAAGVASLFNNAAVAGYCKEFIRELGSSKLFLKTYNNVVAWYGDQKKQQTKRKEALVRVILERVETLFPHDKNIIVHEFGAGGSGVLRDLLESELSIMGRILVYVLKRLTEQVHPRARAANTL